MDNFKKDNRYLIDKVFRLERIKWYLYFDEVYGGLVILDMEFLFLEMF